MFDQLIDLLTLAAGRVSLNLISEFISGGETCVHRDDVESQDQSEGLRGKGEIELRFRSPFSALMVDIGMCLT